MLYYILHYTYDYSYTFKVAIDRSALASHSDMCCDFMTLKIELCTPLHLDLVAAPDGTSEEDHRWNRNRRPQPQTFSKSAFLI